MLSRLSPLGIITTLLVFMPLLFCSGRVLASDWAVSYSYGSGSLPDSDTGRCGTNSSVTKTKTATVTATLTWQGTGAHPNRVKITESASVSWLAAMAGPTVPFGQPPIDPSGTLSGSGSTSLTDVATDDPDPQTISQHGKSITGTREGVYTIPSNGVFTLPSVTLTATATSTTGDQTTGRVFVTLGTYSVSVPDGKAWATATVSIGAVSGWTAGAVQYGESNDGSYVRENYSPSLTVSVGSGTSKEKDLNVSQTFTRTFTPPAVPTTDPFSPDASTSVSGGVSADAFYAESVASVTAEEGADAAVPPAPSLGYAPHNDNLTYSASGDALTFQPTVTAHPQQGNSTATINIHPRAFASTLGDSGRQIQ